MANDGLLNVIESLAQERNLDQETLLLAIESALVSAAKKSIGPNGEYRVEIDRKSGEMRVFHRLEVVEKVVAKDLQISLEKARKQKPDIHLGAFVEFRVESEKEFGRIAAQTARQTIMHKIREAEKERVFSDYKDRAGSIVRGTVRRFDRNDVIIELETAEAVMPSSERVPTEEYQVGDSIQAFVLAVKSQNRGPEIVLSRSHPDFVRKLFEREVTEISDGSVEIMGIAREAGFRSKVSVRSAEENIDPVGACVGMRGIRVKSIVRDLGGEKVDIVRYFPDIRKYVAAALAPAKLAKVEEDAITHRIKVIVDEDQLSLAIGKKGQNARLTSKLTGWKIDIQKDEAKMDFGERVALAINDLAAVQGISREQAEGLVGAGFLTPEGIMAADLEDLAGIEGMTKATAHEVKGAAEKYYEKIHGRFQN